MPVSCSRLALKASSLTFWSPQFVWCSSRISRVPSARCDTQRERITSSVITPPALRITWASPCCSPRMPKIAMRESMQATIASWRRGATSRSWSSKASAYAAFRASSSSAFGSKVEDAVGGVSMSEAVIPQRLARTGSRAHLARVHFVAQIVPAPEASEIVEEDHRRALEVAEGRAGIVRGDDDVRKVPQRVVGGERFRTEHVEACAAEPARSQCVCQGLLIDEF